MEKTNYLSELTFSNIISEKRILRTNKLLGCKTVKKIISLALFLLGGNREKISRFLNIPIGTFFSFLTRFNTKGIDALNNRQPKQNVDEVDLNEAMKMGEGSNIDLIFGDQKKTVNITLDNNKLVVNKSNTLQFRILVLSFMESGFLNINETSELLELSERHIRNLSKNLQNNDVSSLIDKRQGQQMDHVFTEDVKSELIQQYSLNILTGRSTSSIRIAKQINEAQNSSVSERGVRQYIKKLGLNKIKNSLIRLVNDSKKNSKI